MIRRVAAVSPHLDDAALSCASHIAGHPGSWIVRTFAGGHRGSLPFRLGMLPEAFAQETISSALAAGRTDWLHQP
jgi:hypothetical protein